MRTLGQGTDLLFAIPAFVVLRAFVDVGLAVTQETIKQARQLSRHRRDGFGSTESSTQTAVLRAQIALASQQTLSSQPEGQGCSIDDFRSAPIQ